LNVVIICYFTVVDFVIITYKLYPRALSGCFAGVQTWGP